MADPITLTMLASAGSSAVKGGLKAIGGLFAAKAAAERAEFFQEVYTEQQKLNDIVYGRQIREQFGAQVAAQAARGVAGGTTTAAAFDSVFDTQLQLVQRNAQIEFQKVQQEIRGNQLSQNSLMGSLGALLTAGTGVGEAIGDFNAAKTAQADAGAVTGQVG